MKQKEDLEKMVLISILSSVVLAIMLTLTIVAASPCPESGNSLADEYCVRENPQDAAHDQKSTMTLPESSTSSIFKDF